MNKNNLVFVDCEATGPAIGEGELSEFGAVAYPSMETFHGKMSGHSQSINKEVFEEFDKWLKKVCDKQPIFVSDNPAFDFQWINYHFHHLLGYNPFGWSARRIGDYYAGLMGNFRETQRWKRLRITKHTHNPVDDAMGNAEAFKRIQNGER
ncbi:hypothetical protein ES703_69854 [subsurface metagenome]